MPEMSEERIRWMRNRFVEMLTRAEAVSEELAMMREELTRVVDALAEMLPAAEGDAE